MKKLQTLLLTTALFYIGSSYASTCTYNYSIIDCGPGSVENISVSGVARIDGTNVTNQLNVSGSLTAVNASMNNVNVSGSANISNCSISGSAVFSGFLNARSSVFSKMLVINSNYSVLNQTKTNDIQVNLPNSDLKKSLCLKNNTHTGIITFNNGIGVVYEENGSTSSKVINGQVIQSNCPQN